MASGMDNLVMDEVIKRRLLIDGDGVGDDRRLVGLTKSFISWCNADETEEENVSYKRLMSQLNQVEYSAKRTHYNIVTNEKAKAMYSGLGQEVKQEIAATRTEISEAKDLLEEATKHRKHSLEFDALAKLIESKPDRIETEERVGELKKEISIYEKRKDSLNARLESRKKQMFIIATAVDQVEEVLKEHDEYDNMMLNSTLAEEQELPEIIIPGNADSLMETDETPATSDSEQTSPMQQSPDDSPEDSNISGIITSVPLSLSPVEKKSDKYDDLSEASASEGEDRT